MYEDPATASTSQAEVVEELLRQLVDARFVLTDREGSVTRWSRPAEAMFGWPARKESGARGFSNDRSRVYWVRTRTDGWTASSAASAVSGGVSVMRLRAPSGGGRRPPRARSLSWGAGWRNGAPARALCRRVKIGALGTDGRRGRAYIHR